MKSKWTLILPMLTLTFACGPEREDLSLETDASEATSDTVQSTLDASEVIQADYRGEPLAAAADHAGCQGVREVLETATVCDRDYPSRARIAWSCQNGDRSVTGEAEIRTTVSTPDCAGNVREFDQEIDWARERHFGDRGSRIDGTARVNFIADRDARTGEKSVELDVDRRRFAGDELRGRQRIQGAKNVRIERGQDPADDRRTVNGELGVDFILRDARLDVRKDELTFRRGCCHPVAGRVDFTRTRGDDSRHRSVTFGPTCGEATLGNGDALELRPCSSMTD